jgi:hypothetical protein
MLLETVDLMAQLDEIYQRQLFERSYTIEQERALVVAMYQRLRVRLIVVWFMIKLTRVPVVRKLIIHRESRAEAIRV